MIRAAQHFGTHIDNPSPKPFKLIAKEIVVPGGSMRGWMMAEDHG
jgi:hypothetical protein